MTEVSIGLPVYNGEPYLEESLKSLLAQTHRDFELIISDNASADGTQALCERYAAEDKRIRYVRRTDNVRVEKNFNYAKGLATGKYFMWAGADDLWEPNFIEECLRALANDPGAVMAFPDFVFLYDKGRTEKCDPHGYFPFAKGIYERLKQFILYYWVDGKATPIYGLWRHEAVADIFFLPIWGGDMSMVFEALTRGYFTFVPKMLFYKRIPAGRESLKDRPLTRQRVVFSFLSRLRRIGTGWHDMRIFWHASGLSVWQKIKLTGWEKYVIVRLFLKRKA